MASLAVVLIILGCAAFQYFKGTVVRAFATIVIAICASMVAFGFFEVLANVFISRGGSSNSPHFVPWAPLLCFVLLFILVFAGLQTAMMQLTRRPVDFGFLPERIGRVVCGIILGLILSGLLITAFAMAPLSASYPYQRFDERNPDDKDPSGVLLNADGFATGLFSIVSGGSFSGKRSFATLHSDYLNQLFLNRIDRSTSTVTSSPAIEVTKPAVWPASDALRKHVDTLASKSKLGWLRSGYDLMIVRVGIKKRALHTSAAINGGAFALSQLRLVCKQRSDAKDPFTGKGKSIYPVGYLEAEDKIQTSPIKIDSGDFKGAMKKEIDFVFCVPSGFVPVLVEFKLNSIAEIPPNAIVSVDQAPVEPAVFIKSSQGQGSGRRSRQSGFSPGGGKGPSRPPGQQGTPPGGGKRPSRQPGQPGTPPETGGLSDISKSIVGELDEDQ